MPYLCIGRKVAPARPRKLLLELSSNSVRLRNLAKGSDESESQGVYLDISYMESIYIII